ncbi:hypothetical protein GE061_001929 [Apolygus lucorum]|uniref:THAP-type domain-containing protein n=1 Tax=Apolygus lucorum TaxID=248454 RepID=A0A8S9X3Q0_APOLU|nr:hypothetical protein GE061_001929 [Apolygus lucorum]
MPTDCWVKYCDTGHRLSRRALETIPPGTVRYQKVFAFPRKDRSPERAEEWWDRINRPEAAEMDPKVLSRKAVCGLHFHPYEIEDKEMISLVINNKRVTHELDRRRSRLKPGVVPSILPGPESLRNIQQHLTPDEMGRRYCSIDSCPNRKHGSNELSLFLPPKDPQLFCKWAEMMEPHRRLPITRTTGVCELHFQPGEVLREFVTKMQDGTEHRLARGRVSLAPGVFPTIFGRDFKKSKKSSCIEVKAPSTSEKEVTYIFDVGDDDVDDPDSVPPDDSSSKEDVRVSPEETKKLPRKRGRPKKNAKKLESDPEWSKGDISSDKVVHEKKLPSLLRRGRPKKTVSKIVEESEKNESVVDNISDSLEHREGSDGVEDSDCDSDDRMSPVSVKVPDAQQNPLQTDHDYRGGGPQKTTPTTSEVLSTDLRQILGDGSDPDKSIINNVEIFSRLCRSYIVSQVNDRGRKSDMEMRKSPAKKSRIEDEDIFIYPTTNNLDVMTLVYNIDRVKYPSNNWFCTIKDGAPAFLCWGEGFKITKKVIFDSQSLDPTIIIGENEVKLSEVIRPRSIKEVGSILKLADSVELCLRYTDVVRPYTNCKGYFFRMQTDDPNIKQCLLCRNQRSTQCMENRQANERVTFDEICQAAETLVEDRELWSYTVIGSAVVFIGWLKQYRMEKMFIVTREINTRIMMGDEFVNIDKIKYIKTLDDIKAALDFLTRCRKCSGIKMADTKPETRRAENCTGFVPEENPFARISRCKTCSHVRNKVRLRNHRQRMKGQFVRCSADMYPPLKLKTQSLDKTSFEEELAVEDDELSDEGWLVDVLEKVTFPSISWSYVVVDNSIIFQNWDESFVVLKKIIINPDLNVMIYVMDNHVEIEAVQSVENVDDVMRLLNIVDCIQICEGVDDSNSKSEGCTGYYYDPDAKNTDLNAPKRCPNRSRRHSFQYLQEVAVAPQPVGTPVSSCYSASPARDFVVM